MSETASGQRHDSQAMVWPHPADTRGDAPGTQGTTQAHTPGRWHVGMLDAYDQSRVIADNGWLVALVPHARLSSMIPEALANARLIAAAPDLLALAEKVAEHFFGTDSPLGAEAYALLSKVSR